MQFHRSWKRKLTHYLLKNRTSRLVRFYDLVVVIFTLIFFGLFAFTGDAHVNAIYHFNVGVTLFFFSFFIFHFSGVYEHAVRFYDHQMVVSLLASALIIGAFYFLLIGFYAKTWLPVEGFFFGVQLFIGTFLGRFFWALQCNKKVMSAGSPVLIFGTDTLARNLAITLSQTSNYQPLGFIDEHPLVVGRKIHGLRTFDLQNWKELLDKYKQLTIILAVPEMNHHERLRIVDKLSAENVQIRNMPPVDIPVENLPSFMGDPELIEHDLLNRPLVPAERSLMEPCIKNKVVLVTGAGGTIGRNIAKKVLSLEPKSLVLLDHSESAIYELMVDLVPPGTDSMLENKIQFKLGSILDAESLKALIVDDEIETIFHAAAYKHVPILESNLLVSLKNNYLGTKYLVKNAAKAHVENFILISTDKAVRPTNYMGATKRLCELLVKQQCLKDNTTNFCIVRFGNVLGSSGSVAPLFLRQIKSGGPVTVTHPDITRFFMTVSEAVELVLQASSLAKKGETFVLDMGKPIRIQEFAKKLIEMSGRVVLDRANDNSGKKGIGIEIAYTGLRPGEKLHEELLINEKSQKTIHPSINIDIDIDFEPQKLNLLISSLDRAISELDENTIRTLISSPMVGYRGSS